MKKGTAKKFKLIMHFEIVDNCPVFICGSVNLKNMGVKLTGKRSASDWARGLEREIKNNTKNLVIINGTFNGYRIENKQIIPIKNKV